MVRAVYFRDMNINMKPAAILAALLLLMHPSADACTTVIVSAKASSSGKPVMLKHRDTGELNNRVAWFKGPRFTFIGLCDAPSGGGEVWTGTNSAGFSIMNTATYNFKDDDVPDSMMDKEGILMYKALGICETVDDFMHLLDTLPKPLGVEANFGIIDARGGAAHFEVNNSRYIRHDIDEGYKVITNFCESGRREDYKGYERYLTTCETMTNVPLDSKGRLIIDHRYIYDNISRTYRNQKTGVDATGKDYSDVVAYQDFVPRRITSASVVYEGVKPGTDPSKTVMWTMLGYPACSVAIPLVCSDEDLIPAYMKSNSSSAHSYLCDLVLGVKNRYVFGYGKNEDDINMKALLKGDNGRPSLIECSKSADSEISASFNEIFTQWESGRMSNADFYSAYKKKSLIFINSYTSKFSPFLEKSTKID